MLVEKSKTVLEHDEHGLLRDTAFIDGAWVTGEHTFDVTNPADGSLVGTVPSLGAAEATLAVDAAARAQPAWARLTGQARGAVLRRWAALMLENKDALARLMTAEQGKPLAEAAGEVAYAASFLEWFAEEARRVNGALLTPHATDRRLVVRKEPVGVVAAVTPWNFPLAMITRKAGPALAAGCTFVLKPSELTPLSALALARLAELAGVPAGVFNVVMGDAVAIGEVLTGDKRVRKFTFTGSTAVGKMLAARCMNTVKRVSLELGGNAPFIVFDDADLEAAVEGALASKFRNAGQTCVCANRLLVQSGIYDAFAARLAERVAAFVVGAGLAGPTDQGPLIDARAVAKAQAHVQDAVSRGGRILTGGGALTDDAHAGGTFFAPTVIADVPADSLLCREETFGPVAGLVRFETEDEAIAIANDTDAGLAAYVFTRDLGRSWRVPEALAYGMVGLNTGLISTEVAPFGGVKESGIGREGSSFGMDDYLDIKLTCLGI
ncbi:NAD-dependent succinate-semialdehyde dehydrogenase [Novosphingobium sp. MD-1]|uniref:NAD-dependent succinate-semialdehyde dehydrogenase n=1 Tax=Novosphingobium sp. MD-1 TaxID=1630648 RepID=UPI00061B9EB4|nr:NAD-dependent succinate-semialdehyde dehydrogenase [Novosphingobium sp. MD-1]GAO53326.1 NAD(P)+ dependent succinate-semialdehyde dehydrogenase [Novosphingobium sp. MD-1]